MFPGQFDDSSEEETGERIVYKHDQDSSIDSLTIDTPETNVNHFGKQLVRKLAWVRGTSMISDEQLTETW